MERIKQCELASAYACPVAMSSSNRRGSYTFGSTSKSAWCAQLLDGDTAPTVHKIGRMVDDRG